MEGRWEALAVLSIALVFVALTTTAVGLGIRGNNREHHQERMVCLRMNEQANREACLRLVDPQTDR